MAAAMRIQDGNIMDSNLSLRGIKHFFWDFDGTLWDTYPVIIEDLRLSLKEFGFDCDPVEAMHLMLDTIPAARNHYADRFGIPRDALAAAYGRYHALSVRELHSEPFDDLPEVLEQIQSIGGNSYIFTNRKASETCAYLEKYGLSRYFRAVMGSESQGFAYKPSPNALFHLMDMYGIETSEAVMIGDRECDLESGRAAGMHTAHYVCSLAPEMLRCDWRIRSFSEMLALLR